MSISIFIKFLIVIFLTRQAALAKTRNEIDGEEENTSFRSSTFSAIRGAENKTGLRPIGLSKQLRMEQQSSQALKNLPQTNLTDILCQQLTPATKPKRSQIFHETMHDFSRLVIVSTAVAFVVVATIPSAPVLVPSTTVSIPQATASLLPAIIAPKHLSILCLEITSLLQVMTNRHVATYLQTTFVPAAMKLFQKFIVMEAWRRIWLYLGKTVLDHIFPRSTSSWVEFLPSSWTQEIASFIDTSLQRGVESTFKKSIRTVVEKNISFLLEKLSP